MCPSSSQLPFSNWISGSLCRNPSTLFFFCLWDIMFSFYSGGELFSVFCFFCFTSFVIRCSLQREPNFCTTQYQVISFHYTISSLPRQFISTCPWPLSGFVISYVLLSPLPPLPRTKLYSQRWPTWWRLICTLSTSAARDNQFKIP